MGMKLQSGERKNVYKILLAKPERNRQRVRLRCKHEDDTKRM
jgi:hypothetical protein